MIAFVAVVAALVLINAVFQPFHGDGYGSVRLTIRRTSGRSISASVRYLPTSSQRTG